MAANNWGIRFNKTQQDRIDFSTSLTIQDLSTFSFDAWIKVGPLATSPEQRAFAMRQGGGKKGIRFALTPYKGKLRFELARKDNTNDTNYTCDVTWDDYWHHVAFTADTGEAKEYKIYLDGALKLKGKVADGGKSGSDPLKISNTASGDVHIGAWDPNNNGVFTYWDGKIDNIRLWNTVLSQSQIQSQMFDHISDPATESGLIEEIRFNNGSGTTTAGSKNTGWTGTLRRAGSASSALWNTDRPFMGDGEQDETAPTNPTMSAPTSINSDGFTLNWSGGTDNVYLQFYELTVATDNAFDNPVDGYAGINVGLDMSKVITGLAPATNYYARVRAIDAAGNASDYVTYNSNAVIVTPSSADLTAPTAPVQTSATSITSSAFTANWGAATDNIGVTGYKIDVGMDSSFSTFAAGFRNLDVGNVLSKAVNIGLAPLTPYYVRVRAYDAAGNESADSNTITVITAAPPDIIAPAIVVLQSPTSVTARSATANWNVGVDNVGVTGYRLDVALDEEFTELLTNYQNLDVGNVTSYGLTNLTPNTEYFYRVRAYDAAGNVSSNTLTPEPLNTLPSSIEDGGMLEVAYEPTQDTYIWQTNSTTNYGSDTSLRVREGSGNIAKTILQFDISDYDGELVNANLRLYVTDTTPDTLQIQRATGTWNEDTITYANSTLLLTGSTIDFFLSGGTGEWTEIDVSSLITNGPGVYTLVISNSSGTNEAIFDSTEGTNHPVLVLETDPTNATQIDGFDLSASNVTFTNLLKNPSAEIGGPNFGSTTGIDKIAGGDSLLQDSTYAYDGTYSVKVVTAASSGAGAYFESPTGLARVVVSGDNAVEGVVAVRANSSTTQLRAVIRAFYTDASTSQTSGTEFVSTINVPGGVGWILVPVSTLATVGKTIDKVRIYVYQNDAVSKTFWMDAALVTFGLLPTTNHFNGGTAVDTDWATTAHASKSTYDATRLIAEASYIGDGDGDNSVVAEYRRTGTTDWTRPYLRNPSNNRSTKQVSITLDGFDMGNLLFNPSFTLDTEYWSAASSASITRIISDGVEDPGADDLACLEVVTSGSSAVEGVLGTQLIPCFGGDDITFSFWAKSISGPQSLKAYVIESNSAGAGLNNLTSTVTITEEWARYSMTVAPNSGGLSFVSVAIFGGTAEARTYRVDRLMVDKRNTLAAYTDGSQPDGRFSGLPHKSASYRIFEHDVDYDVQFTFSDPDGIEGPEEIGLTVRTPFTPDNLLSVDSMTLTPESDRIFVEVSYNGDDNGSSNCQIEWRRSDQSTWIPVTSSFDRAAKKVLATVAGLYEGTDYTVRATFTDNETIYGSNPILGIATTTIAAPTTGSREHISFDGFMLSGGDSGDIWVNRHNGYDFPLRRLQIQDMPRTDGGVETSDWWGTREIQIEGGVRGATRMELFSNLEALRRALAKGQKNLVIDTLSVTNRHFLATCESFEAPEDAEENYTHLNWTAVFQCADPFRYAADDTVEANISLANGQTVVLTNDGDLSVDALFTISPISSTPIRVTLTNTTTGERITPAATFVTGDVLKIDSALRSTKKNNVEIDYAGGYPRLAVGQNTYKVSLSAGSVLMTVRRRHRYF